MLLFEQTFCPPCLCLYSSSTAVAASAAATVDVRNRGKGREPQFTEIDDDNNRLGEEKCVQESEGGGGSVPDVQWVRDGEM